MRIGFSPDPPELPAAVYQRQDADFYWLTGINEPDAFLVLQPRSPYRPRVVEEIWGGSGAERLPRKLEDVEAWIARQR